MYKVGELIFYGGTGVCRVEGIEERREKGVSRPYYVLKPTCQDGTIYIPVDTKVYMRPVISREEAERIIDAIPGIKAEAIQERSFTQLAAIFACVPLWFYNGQRGPRLPKLLFYGFYPLHLLALWGLRMVL